MENYTDVKRLIFLAKFGIVESTDSNGNYEVQGIDDVLAFSQENNLTFVPPKISDKQAKQIFNVLNIPEGSEREKFLQALTNFNFAWSELSRLWGTYWKNNDLADYPFEESFDELALRVSEWVDESKDLVYAKDITDQKIVKRNFISTLEIMRDEKSCGINFAIGGDIIPLCYWNSDEWEEDPETVVPAMTNAIELFYTDKELLLTTLGYKIID